jgi:hypothetical protein
MKKVIKPEKARYELSVSGDIVTTKSRFVKGSFINDKEVETKTDYIFYSNGNVLLKSYRNNYLYSVSLMKDSDTLRSSISK